MTAKRAPRIMDRLPEPSEADILRQVRQYLRLKGWSAYRIQQGMGAVRGMPDLIAIRAGRVVWIEVKSRTGRLSVHQEAFQAEIAAQGGEYLVVRRVEDIIAAVREEGA